LRRNAGFECDPSQHTQSGSASTSAGRSPTWRSRREAGASRQKTLTTSGAPEDGVLAALRSGKCPRPRKQPPARLKPGDHRRCNRSSSVATVLPCQRPPRGVATFRLVSSSAIFSTGRWRSSIKISRSVFAYCACSPSPARHCRAGRRALWQPRALVWFGSRCCGAPSPPAPRTCAA
jgi:hypothetical protein